MDNLDIQREKALAERICKEQHDGKHDGIGEIFEKYQNEFFGYLKKNYSYDNEKVEVCLQDFFCKKLIAEKAICNYKNFCESLPILAFLFTVLRYHSIDCQRRVIRDGDRLSSLYFQSDDSQKQTNILDENHSVDDDALIDERDRKQITKKILRILSEKSPKDAEFLHLLLKERSYEEIANSYGLKNTDVLRQRYSRAIKKCNKIMRELGINQDDLF